MGYLPDDAGYMDGALSVRIEERTIRNTRVYFTFVDLSDVHQFRSATFRKYPSKDTGSVAYMAKRENAVLAINADWFTKRKEGTVYRDGICVRDHANGVFDGLVVDDQGDFHILHRPDRKDYAAFEGRIWQSFVFGPGLVIDGEITEDFGVKTLSPNRRTQRQVICQMDHLSYLIITTEGPEQSRDGGFTLKEMAEMAWEMGARQAYNMDGGSSVWLVLGDEKLNARGKKLNVGDCLYFVSEIQGAD
ncbi:MAG: phosphodiester glycosidase family protein [Clostridia bacterium]|nr:phosphodiester glycosidase family protein [Clostridia bacterium]